MKKFLPVILIFILLGNFVFVKPKPASANAVVKIVAGSTAEKIMVGIGEKAGVKFASKTAKDRAMQKWNYDFHNMESIVDDEIRARVQKFRNDLDNAEVIPMPNKPGYSKVILSTAGFLTGADLIYDGIKAFEDAKTNAELEAVMAEDYASGNMYINGLEFKLFSYTTDYGENNLYGQFGIFYPDDEANNFIKGAGTSVFENTAFNYYRIDEKQDFTWTITWILSGKDKRDYTIHKEIPLAIDSARVKQEEPIEVFTPKPEEILTYDAPEVLTPLTTSSSPNKITEMPTLPEEEIEIIIPDGPLAEPSPDAEPANKPLEDDGKDPDKDTGTNPDTGTGTNPDTGTGTNPDTGTGTNPDTGTGTNPDTGTGTNPDPTNPTDPPTGGEGEGSTPPKINWKKLKEIPLAFTTAFPFSLPWDIAGALDATFGSIEEQEGPIEFTWNVYKQSTPITFSVPEMFLEWFKYIRTFILIIFDIGFIYAVRKLLGGAS